jgi:hypothetical protein
MAPRRTWDPGSLPPRRALPAAATTASAFAYEQCDVAPGLTLSEWRTGGGEPPRPGALRRLLRRG